MRSLSHETSDRDRNKHFDVLSREQQAAAIKRMARDGYSELSIAAATRLSVEMVRQIHRLGQLEAIGGRPYIARLVEDAPSAGIVRNLARLVRERWAERQREEIGLQIAESKSDPNAVKRLVERLVALNANPIADECALVSLEEFVKQPDVAWQAENLFHPRDLVAVFGPPKGGKTFSFCDLLMHGAHGLPWHGHAFPAPLRVAFLEGEGISGLKVRLHGWLTHHDTAELRGAITILPRALSLPDRRLTVIDRLQPFRPDVVLVDTLNAFFGDGDENSTADMTRFIAACRELRDSLGCTVIVVHHSGLAESGRERGSGALRGAVDVVIQVAKDEGGSGLVGFQVIAGRDVEAWQEPLSLRLRRVETDWLDHHGRPLSTCIVEAANAPVTLPGRGGRKLSDQQRTTIEVVQLLARQLANGSSTVLLHRHEIVAEAIKRGVSRPAAYRHLNDLAERMQWKLLEPGSLEVRI